MGEWRGLVKSGEFEMNAFVSYQIPPFAQGEWRGSGRSNSPWEMGQIDTNIGIIMIVSIKCDQKGVYDIKFVGSGDPKGSLAKAMGWKG